MGMRVRLGRVNGRATSYHFYSPITSQGEKKIKTCKCICPICKMYLSGLQNVFVQFAKMYLSELHIYLSKGAASYHLHSPITSWGEKRGEMCKSFKTLETGGTNSRPKNTRGNNGTMTTCLKGKRKERITKTLLATTKKQSITYFHFIFS